RAELEDRGREQEDAVLRDALGRTGAVVLLLEDQPLPQRRVATAVRRGPGHDRVARREELAFPFEVRGESVARVARRERRLRDVRLEPSAALGAEGLFFGGEREIHGKVGDATEAVRSWSHGA